MGKREEFDFTSLEESGELAVEDTPKEETTTEVEEVVEEEVVEEVVVEEEEVEEDVQEDVVEEPVQKKKEPYTAEEIQDILKSDGEVDTERLSPAEQATMKAMQRAFTPKLQEAADLRREMEDMKRSIEDSKPKAEPTDIYQAYDQDPEGVLKYVDSQINEIVQSGTPDLAQIRQLESLKYDFNRRDLKKFQDNASTQVAQTKHMQEILTAVPDLATKQGALKDFAINELGYTEQELANETNPSIAGSGAARVISRINTAYDKAQARVTVRRKRVKKPTNVEKPSANGIEKPTGDTDFKSIKAKASESGNYDDFFAALEEED